LFEGKLSPGPREGDVLGDAVLSVMELVDVTCTGLGGQAPFDPDVVDGRGDEIATRFS
jgi:hypothetical protein